LGLNTPDGFLLEFADLAMAVGLRFAGGGGGGSSALMTGEFKKAEGEGMVMVSIADTSCDCDNTLVFRAMDPAA
jgi:hypothetical protein